VPPRAVRRGWGRREQWVAVPIPPDRGGLLFVLGAVLGGIGRFCWRYRSELAPVYTAVLLFVVAAWLHVAYGTAAGAWTAVGTGLVSVGLALVPDRWAAWFAGRFRVGPNLTVMAERVNAVAVVATAGGWVAAGTIAGPRHRVMLVILLAAMVGLGCPWWLDRRRRNRVHVDRTFTQRWDGEIAERVGLLGSRVLSAEPTGERGNFMARLALYGGMIFHEALPAGPRLESVLDTRHGAVRMEPDPGHANHVILHVTRQDPHAQPVALPATAAGIPGVVVHGTRHPARQSTGHTAGQAGQSGRPVAVPAVSIAKPVPLGVFADGRPVTVSLLRRHVLIGGATGSGKSGVVNVIMAALTARSDVMVWGIDLKQGMELRPWAGCLGRLAVTPEQASDLLRAAVAELERRAALMAEHGAREWTPRPDTPALVVMIDEYAELPEHARELADRIARLGRAVAVTLIVATQRPTQAVMGGGAVRSQMDVRICLRVREQRDTDLILGQGMLSAGWQPHKLDAAGKFLLSAPEHSVPRPARAYWLSDAQVIDLALANVVHRPARALIPTVQAGPDPASTDRSEPGTESGPDTGPDEDRDSGTPEGGRGALGALWAALRAAPDYGVTVAELMAASGLSRTSVYRHLQQAQQAGHVEQSYRGRWRATDPNRASGDATDAGHDADRDPDGGTDREEGGSGDVT
jgi:S-DNA-T family DNA segregation ATPase FtsK/SpoIIIE